MHKRLLCLLLVLAMALPVFASDSLQVTHNENFYQLTINPDDCLFDITDALSLEAPQYTAEQALSDRTIAPSIVSISKTLLDKDALKTAEAMLHFVQEHITLIDDENAPLYAADVLEKKRANIHGANNLLLAMLHAVELPAIRTVGRLTDEEFDPNATVNHAWCEVLYKNQWHVLDLTQKTPLTELPKTHIILRRGPVTNSSELLFEKGFRYTIQNGGVEICGADQPKETYTLNIPTFLGGLPVLSIGKEAFSEMVITELSFPNTLQKVGRKAFFHSTVPEEIHIPASITNIEEYAFSYLNGLYAVIVDSKNPAYLSEDGVLYSKDQSALWVYPHEKRDTAFSVPKKVSLLFCTCFSGNPYLTEITFSNPETKAMTYTFYGCRLNLLGPSGSAIEKRLNDGGLTEHLTFIPQTLAEEGSLMHFVAKGPSPKFEDVSDSAWFYPDLDSVFRQGLLVGISETQFGTDLSVTLAQAITMSTRVRLRYRDNASLPQAEAGEEWYQPALNQAFENQWFVLPDISDLNRPATRGEFAQILAGALPQNALPARTAITESDILDLPADPDVRTAILTLYRAGILAGTPDGCFHPEKEITRAEAAAILARLTDVTRRLYFDERI